MKRINLIPDELKSIHSLVGRRSVRIVGALLVFAVLHLCWQSTAIWRYKYLIGKQKKTIKELKITQVKAASTYERIRSEREQIRKDEELLSKKLATLKQSQRKGILWSKVLIDLSEDLPGPLWLSRLKLNPEEIGIEGKAVNNSDVTAFMARLDESQYFFNTGFDFIQEAKDPDESMVVFEIKTNLNSSNLIKKN